MAKTVKVWRISPEKCAIAINTLRGEFSAQAAFEREEIINLLKEYGIPASTHYFASYLKNGIILKVKRGEYHFSSTPVYKGVLEQALNDARETNYTKVSKQTIHEEPIQLEPDHSEEDEIQKAIVLLKEHGFLILRQV